MRGKNLLVNLLVDLTRLPDIPALHGPFDAKIRGGGILRGNAKALASKAPTGIPAESSRSGLPRSRASRRFA